MNPLGALMASISNIFMMGGHDRPAFRAGTPERGLKRHRTAVKIHNTRKQAAHGYGELVKKASAGTLTIPGGRRGLQVRRIDGVDRITT